MNEVQTNIAFKSNLYLLDGAVPYNDFDFVQNVYDPEKLRQIKRMTILKRFPEEQEIILQKNAICVYHKKYANNKSAQYFVLRKENGKLKDLCKCRILECPFISKCRPHQKEQIEREIKLFSACKKSLQIDTQNYNPVMFKFERITERYGDFAYEIISNIDMKKYIEKKYEKVSFAYRNGNASNWDNWVGGDDKNNFHTGENSLIPSIPLEIKKTDSTNPLLDLQRQKLERSNNPFFNQIPNKYPYKKHKDMK